MRLTAHHVVSSRSVFNLLKDAVERVGNDAPEVSRLVLALHRVRLARAGLPVREDGSIVALERGVNDGQRCVVENLRL